jgi:hypothetical protein
MAYGRREAFGTPRRLELTAPARGVRVVLVRRGGARLRLLTPDGKPFADEVFEWFVGESGGNGGSHTPEDGVLSRWDEKDGTYVWTLRPRGYAWIRRTVVIEAGAAIDFGDVVAEPGVDVTGRVLDPAGRPVVNARITCPQTEGDRWARTGPDGRFAMDRFPSERFSLVVEAEGFCTVPVTVEPGRTKGIEVRLPRRVTVRGRVRIDGRPARIDSLEFLPDGKRTVPPSDVPMDGFWRPFTEVAGPTWTSVAADGTFEVSLTPGRWVAVVDAGDDDGTETVVGEWTFADDASPTIEVTLPAAPK